MTKIVLIDDDQDSCLLIKTFLSSIYHKGDIIEFFSGKAVLDYFKLDTQAPCTHSVDLILLDVLMPDLNGIEVCSRIKANNAFDDIPVLMVTASNELEFLADSFEAGAIDFINKPIRKVELLARVRSALRLKNETMMRRMREQELIELNLALKENNLMLEQLAIIDKLTGIHNRGHLDWVLSREWANTQRNQAPLSLIMIDIDYFKCYNDAYGHLGGDDCLRQVAQALHSRLRRKIDFVGRYGGEEFMVILPGVDHHDAMQLAESFRKDIQNLGIPHAQSKNAEVVTISLGLSTLTHFNSNDHSESLIHCADQALYQAKNAGRNQVCFLPYTEL
jgi:diguanylate cyclase (GGDEF)-like protein